MAELAHLAVANAAPLRIVQHNPNGSIVCEFPVLSTGTIDLSKTAGKGGSTLAVTPDVLNEIAFNLAHWPMPVPINVAPHRSFSEIGGPAPGFVDALEVRGDKLWARCTINAPLASEVEAGAWRGFSCDLVKNASLPAKDVPGWAMWAGVLTNTPAGAVNFTLDSVAASIADAELCVVQLSLEPALGERRSTMADVKAPELIALEAQMKAQAETMIALSAKADRLNEENATLRTALDDKSGKFSALEAQLATEKAVATQRQTMIVALEKKIEAIEEDKRTLAADLAQKNAETVALNVRSMIEAAIDRGVLPALFDGWDSDPNAWFKDRFASLEAFESFVKALPATEKPRVSSGRPVAAADTASLSQERRDNLQSLNLDPDFASVKDGEDLKRVLAKKK